MFSKVQSLTQGNVYRPCPHSQQYDMIKLPTAGAAKRLFRKSSAPHSHAQSRRQSLGKNAAAHLDSLCESLHKSARAGTSSTPRSFLLLLLQSNHQQQCVSSRPCKVAVCHALGAACIGLHVTLWLCTTALLQYFSGFTAAAADYAYMLH